MARRPCPGRPPPSACPPGHQSLVGSGAGAERVLVERAIFTSVDHQSGAAQRQPHCLARAQAVARDTQQS